ncbi:MAG: hypothetical protein FWD34_03425 [Oscillospiraceae bacterium]|nr:hypothetical protein [Oscillospiraceae bacterium]
MKKLLSIIIACALCMSLVVTASAATFDLPTTPPKENNKNQWIYGSEGMEGENVPGLTWAILKSAKKMIVVLKEAIPDEELEETGIGMVWQAPVDGWGWNQQLFEVEDVYNAATKTITFDLTKMKNYDDWLEEEERGKLVPSIYIGEDDGGWAEVGIEKIYLDGVTLPTTTTTTPPPEGDKVNEPTGVTGVAVLTGVAVIAVGAIALSRKRKQ